MEQLHPLLWGLLFSIVFFVVSSMMMAQWLSKQGVPINYLFIRFMIPVYAFRFRRLSQQKTGRTGWLFYIWILSINLALICFLLYLLFR